MEDHFPWSSSTSMFTRLISYKYVDKKATNYVFMFKIICWFEIYRYMMVQIQMDFDYIQEMVLLQILVQK